MTRNFTDLFLLIALSASIPRVASLVPVTSLGTFSTAVKDGVLCPCGSCTGQMCTDCVGNWTFLGKGCRDTFPGHPFEVTMHQYYPNRSGVIRILWFTGELLWPNFGNITVRVYTDNETVASVQFRLFESHALGFGWNQGEAHTWGTKQLGKGSLEGGLYVTFNIPFQSGFTLTAQLPEEDLQPLSPSSHVVWYMGRGLLGMPVIIDDTIQLPPSAKLRIHRVALTATPQSYVTLLNVTTGGGTVVFLTMHASSGNAHYLEGEVSAIVDGVPMTLSSGTEDYFLSAQYFDAGQFQFPNSGCNHLDLSCLLGSGICRVAAYRSHEADPIVFQTSLILRWQVGDGKWLTDNVKVVFNTWVYHHEG